MSIELLTILLFTSMVVFLVMGAPVGFSMGGIAIVIGYFTWGPKVFKLIQPTAMNTISGFVLLAIPLFIFMGQILLKAGIGEKMFDAFHVLAGRVRGGLAIGVIVVCSAIAAMVGVIAAGIMTAGTVALPPMLKKGYNKNLAIGSVMAGGGMGILIPPSIPMILFASVTSTSVGRMFAGGLIPGLIMSGLFIVYIIVRCRINPEYGPVFNPEKKIKTKDKVIALRDTFVAFGLIVIVLGCIMGGVATTTEAAAIGAVGAMLIAFFYGRLNWSVLKDSSVEGMKLTSICIWLFIGALVFNNFHMMMGAGRLVRELTAESGLSPFGIIILMQVSILFMGFIMDDFVILLLCSPIYTPIAMALGFDPIWFGILMILQMEIAIQTPPYGFALFYMKAVVPEGVTMLDIYKSITPFLIVKIIVLIICMAFPEIVTWLPNLLFQ
jgi:tripartite ATP-independent transporter DctM subunit